MAHYYQFDCPNRFGFSRASSSVKDFFSNDLKDVLKSKATISIDFGFPEGVKFEDGVLTYFVTIHQFALKNDALEEKRGSL